MFTLLSNPLALRNVISGSTVESKKQQTKFEIVN